MSYEQRQTMLRERFKDHVCDACGTRGHSSRWFGCPKHQHHDRFLRDSKEAAGTQGNTNRRGQGTVTARKIAEAADAIADILDQGDGRADAPDGKCDGHVITDALVGDGADAGATTDLEPGIGADGVAMHSSELRECEPLTDGGDVGLPLNDAGALLAHAHEDGVAYVLSACEVPCSMVEILGQSSLHPTSRCDPQE